MTWVLVFSVWVAVAFVAAPLMGRWLRVSRERDEQMRSWLEDAGRVDVPPHRKDYPC